MLKIYLVQKEYATPKPHETNKAVCTAGHCVQTRAVRLLQFLGGDLGEP